MPAEVGTRMNLANALGKIDRAEEAAEAYEAVYVCVLCVAVLWTLLRCSKGVSFPFP